MKAASKRKKRESTGTGAALAVGAATGLLAYRYLSRDEAAPRLRLVRGIRPLPGGITVEKTVLVNARPEEAYRFWRKYKKDAEITEEVPNQSVMWRSLTGGPARARGAVTFEPAAGGRGTMIKVLMTYEAMGGKWLSKIAKMFGEAPEQHLKQDLRRIKMLMETGEIATTEGQPRGGKS